MSSKQTIKCDACGKKITDTCNEIEVERNGVIFNVRITIVANIDEDDTDFCDDCLRSILHLAIKEI